MRNLFIFLLCFAILQSYSMAKNLGRLVGPPNLPAICHNQNDILIPMPGSCTGFFICVDGHAIASSCGGFYHFNAHTGLCDHPMKAACYSRAPLITDTFSGTTTTITKLVSRPSLPKPKYPNEVIADLSAGPICKNLPTGVLLPKWGSCMQYYVCIYERPYRRTCPPLLHFNATSGLCQDPTMAKCVNALDDFTKSGGKQSNKTRLFSDSTTTKFDNADILADVDIDSEDGICAMSSDGTLLSYPGDCSRFIFCMQHQPFVLFCPNGHHFSWRYGRCEWSSIEKCSTLT